MGTVLARLGGRTKLMIEPVEDSHLLVNWRERTRPVGHVRGLGRVIEGTGQTDRSKLVVRKLVGGLTTPTWLADVPPSSIGSHLRRPTTLRQQEIDAFDAQIREAEQRLAELRRERRRTIEAAFAEGVPLERDPLVAHADGVEVLH
jgi:hypothetical protein